MWLLLSFSSFSLLIVRLVESANVVSCGLVAFVRVGCGVEVVVVDLVVVVGRCVVVFDVVVEGVVLVVVVVVVDVLTICVVIIVFAVAVVLVLGVVDIVVDVTIVATGVVGKVLTNTFVEFDDLALRSTLDRKLRLCLPTEYS